VTDFLPRGNTHACANTAHISALFKFRAIASNAKFVALYPVQDWMLRANKAPKQCLTDFHAPQTSGNESEGIKAGVQSELSELYDLGATAEARVPC
jgi:hypothetical protein